MPDYTQIYPYNIVPQFRSMEKGEPKLSCLKCPADTEIQAVVFTDSKLSIVKGYDTKSDILLKEVFVPAKEYLEYEFTLDINTADDFITLNYGNLKNSHDGVDFVAIVPVYHSADLENQSYWHLNFRYSGETTWRKLGRVFMWSATSDNPVPVIELQNRQAVPITIKVLIAGGYY